ncbi:MAG: lytic transglycosylase domain-containing protein [Alphaproteobacteria bacterium]|jgi:hypothetical protein
MFFFGSSPTASSAASGTDAPVARSAENGANRIVDAISSAAKATGTRFEYLLRTAQRESSLQPTAQAPTSSARGLYQFIDSTWLTMMQQDGKRFGLDRYADQIERGANGRPTVADPDARRQILALRDDPQVSSLMAGAFTVRNASDLRASIGRDPTEGELYMAHFLGSGGASRLIGMAQNNPSASAATQFPDAADANRRIFFDRGRPRTVAEVYQVLAGGASTPMAAVAPASGVASTDPSAPATVAAAQAPADYGSWAPIARVNAQEGRPFHSMFSGNAGPINAFVAATWGAVQARVNPSNTVGPAHGDTSTTAAAPTPAPRGVGGPYVPLFDPTRRGSPLDLAQFLQPALRRPQP